MAKRILIIGVNKAGKSSVVQELAEQNGDDPYSASSERSLIRRGIEYRFIEAAGLAEAVQTQIDEERKIIYLKQLTVLTSNAIDLIIYVTRQGTIHNDARDIYTLVAGLICDKVPIICVVTRCENEFDMNQWAETNRSHFERNQMFFNRTLGTCFARGGRLEAVYAPLRKESGENLWKAIEQVLLNSHSQNRRKSTVTNENDHRKVEESSFDEPDALPGNTASFQKPQEREHRDSAALLRKDRTCYPAYIRDLISPTSKCSKRRK